MSNDVEDKEMSDVIWIDKAGSRIFLDEMVRGTLEETLNAMLEPTLRENIRTGGPIAMSSLIQPMRAKQN